MCATTCVHTKLHSTVMGTRPKTVGYKWEQSLLLPGKERLWKPNIQNTPLHLTLRLQTTHYLNTLDRKRSKCSLHMYFRTCNDGTGKWRYCPTLPKLCSLPVFWPTQQGRIKSLIWRFQFQEVLTHCILPCLSHWMQLWNLDTICTAAT